MNERTNHHCTYSLLCRHRFHIKPKTNPYVQHSLYLVHFQRRGRIFYCMVCILYVYILYSLPFVSIQQTRTAYSPYIQSRFVRWFGTFSFRSLFVPLTQASTHTRTHSHIRFMIKRPRAKSIQYIHRVVYRAYIRSYMMRIHNVPKEKTQTATQKKQQ